MAAMWQELATLAIVCGACVYLARKWFWPKQGSSSSCSTCETCPSAKRTDGQVISVESLQTSPKLSGDRNATGPNKSQRGVVTEQFRGS